MPVISIASLEGEPRAVVAALEHHWRDHPRAEGLLERIVAHGPDGFVVIETWTGPAEAAAAWDVIRLEGVPAPDLRRYEVLSRTGAAAPAGAGWAESALPPDAAWDERVVPRDS